MSEQQTNLGQRIYNPAMPPTPPRGPSAAMVQQGVAPAMDMQGPWGGPANG